MQRIRDILLHPFGFSFAGAHLLLWSIAMYQRGGLDQQFHFYYEPLLHKLLIVVDIVCVWLSDVLIGGNTLAHPRPALLLTVVFGSVQWFIVGCTVGRLN